MRAVVVAVVVTMAGCLGGSQDATGPDALDAAAVGSIEGSVVSEEIVGIPGVNVSIPGRNVNTTTDEAGQFSFHGLEPTAYTLRFMRLGFNERTMEVQVFAGDTNRVSVVLLANPSDFPYSEVVIKRGFWYCGFQYVVAGLYCASNPTIPTPLNVNQFNLTIAPGWNETVLEQRWDRNAGLTTSGRAYSYIRTLNKTDNETYNLMETIRGESPLYAKLYPGYVGHKSYTAVLGANYTIPRAIGGLAYAAYPWGVLGAELAGIYPEQPGVPNQGLGATLQTPFDVYFAQFYYRPSPDGYSSIPDT